MILEFVFEVDIIWTHFLHILDNVNGNHSFTLFPFYLINIFITKLLEEKPIRERRGFSSFCDKMLPVKQKTPCGCRLSLYGENIQK